MTNNEKWRKKAKKRAWEPEKLCKYEREILEKKWTKEEEYHIHKNVRNEKEKKSNTNKRNKISPYYFVSFEHVIFTRMCLN